MRERSRKRRGRCPHEGWICAELLRILEEKMAQHNKRVIPPKSLLKLVWAKDGVRRKKLRWIKNTSLLENFFRDNKVLSKYREKVEKGGDLVRSLERVLGDHPDWEYIRESAIRRESRFDRDEERSCEIVRNVLSSLPESLTFGRLAFLREYIKTTRLGGECTLYILRLISEEMRKLGEAAYRQRYPLT